jgi:hypothetical protein
MKSHNLVIKNDGSYQGGSTLGLLSTVRRWLSNSGPATLAVVLCTLVVMLPLADTASASKSVSVDAQLSHQSFAVDQAARLTITVTGGRDADIELPRVDNLRFQPRGQSSQINMVNGNFSSSIAYNYLVQGMEPGEYTIAPITVRVGAETLHTEPIKLTITKSGQLPESGQQGSKNIEDIAFIRITPGDKQKNIHFSGELVPITLRLYLSSDYKFEIDKLPVLVADGVVMEPLSEKPQQTRERLDGNTFIVVSWQTTLSGIKTGSHPFSFSLEAGLLLPRQRQARSPFSGSSPFGGSLFDDSIFDNFFGNYERRQVNIKSPELQFTVLPLPEENRPPGFSGAIGDFSLSITASPTEVEVGEPITLTSIISGRGNFDRVEAPHLPESGLWKSYSPTAEFKPGTEAGSGSKSFEQAVVIRKKEVAEIPPLSFSYFDPLKKSYRTLTSPPIALKVKGALKGETKSEGVGSTTAQQPAPPQPAPGQQPVAAVAETVPSLSPPLPGLAPQKLEPGSYQSRLQPLYLSSWYLTASALLLLSSVIALIVRYRRQKLRSNPQLQRQKEGQKVLVQDLLVIERAISSGDSGVFLTSCRRAIQNQFADRCHVAPAAISLSDLRSETSPDSALRKIFSLADQAAYGGAALSAREMSELYADLKRELEGVQK